MSDLTLRTVLTADGSQLATTLDGSARKVDGFTRTTEGTSRAAGGLEAAMQKALASVAAVAIAATQAGTGLQGLQTRMTATQLAAQQNADRQRSMATYIEQSRAATERYSQSLSAQATAEIEARTAATLRSTQFVAALQAEAGAIGKSRTELLQLQAAQLGVSEAAAPFIQRIAQAGNTQVTAANGSKQFSYALRGLPAQITDIIVSLQGGQAPMTVFLQQGGQIRDMFGSFTAAARGVASVVMGLVNPFTVAAAAAALVGYQYYKGQQEAAEFNKVVVLSGQVAGVTATQLAGIAKQTAQLAQGGTQARAAELLTGIASATGIGATNMARFTAASMDFQRVGGTAAEEVLQAFQSLSKSPLESALKLNESTNFLTVATYKQAKAYTDAGESAKAAQVLQESYFDTLKQRTADMEANLGLISRAWHDVKDWANEAWDAMTIRDADVQKVKDQASTISNFLSLLRGAIPAPLPYALGVATSGTSGTDAAEASAAARAKEVQQAKELAKWDQQGVQYLTWQKQLGLEIKAIREQGAKAGVDQEAIDKRIAAARERFDPGVPQAQLESQLASTRRNLDQMTEAYKDADAVISALRQAGKIEDTDYYASKTALVRASTDTQVAGLRAESAELDRINQLEKTSTAERIANKAKIADNQSKVTQLTSSAAAQVVVLGIQQTSAIDGLAKAYVQARQAAQDYLDTLKLGQNRELDLFTAGPDQRQTEQGRTQITDRYAAERLRIQNERAQLTAQQGGSLTSTQEKQFAQQLSLQQEFESKALESYSDFVSKRTAMEGDWSTGAQRAWNEYLEKTRNVSQQTHDLLQNALEGGTDALANFLAAGKFTFNEFGRVVGQVAQGVLADLLKIYIRQQLVGAVGSMFGASAGSAGAVNGSAGSTFIPANVAHGGGQFGTDSFAQRAMSSRGWGSAPRHHTGLASDEYAAVIRRDESVLTPGQMRQLGPVGASPVVNVNLPSINLINNSGTPMKASAQRRQDGGFDLLLEAVEQGIAGNVASGTGSLDQALRGRYGLQATMGA